MEYSKDLFTFMILDGQLQLEEYSFRDGVIYYHGRILFPRTSKLREKFLQATYEDLIFSPTCSMRAYHTIMEGYLWEGFEEEIYQHMKRCMDWMEMEERHDSLEELTQPLIFSLRRRGDSSMSHSICMSRTYGKGDDCLHDYLLDVCFLTIYV